jgi:uncharacterized repeat protein (TIGR02543 family)
MLQAREYPSESQALEYPSLNEAMLNYVTFQSNGGSAVSPQDVAPGSKITRPAIPTRTGCTFSGWFTDAALTSQWDFNNTTGSVGGFPLYAKWAPAAYTITWRLNGGTEPGNPAAYTIEDEIVFLPATRPGYTFGGWYEDSQFETAPVTGIPVGSTGNKTYYAKWDLITYFITYHLDGGTNHEANPASYTVESAAIALQPPEKHGYTFLGWFTDADFTRPVETIPHGSTGDMEIWAKWEVTVYPILYVTNGGDNDPRNPSTYTVLDNIYLYPPDRPGFEFAGWFDNEAYEGSAISRILPGTARPLLLYARWSRGEDVGTAKEIDLYSGDPKIYMEGMK